MPLESSRQALELLFRLNEELGLVPMEVDGTMVLGLDAAAEKSPKLAAAIKAWKDVLDSEKAGEINPAELDAGRPDSASEQATRGIIANQKSGLRAAFSCPRRLRSGSFQRELSVCYSPSFTCSFVISVPLGAP